MRGVTACKHRVYAAYLFQLTRLMRGVTAAAAYFFGVIAISTHTPHARRDIEPSLFLIASRISTHTPHARRDEKCLVDP